jgi:alpha-maltose-1-phosphate synthase
MPSAVRTTPAIELPGTQSARVSCGSARPMKKPAILISHPTGNQNLRNALLSLVESGMLAEFWTTIAWDLKSTWNKLLPSGLRSQLGRRSYPGTPKDRIHCVPLRETIRLAAKPLRLEGLLASGERPFSVIGMYRNFDARVARHLRKASQSRNAKIDAAYAYEGGALNTFREARDLGISAMYELPSSHWYWEQKLLSEEAERNPQFSALLPQLKDSPRHMQWKDEELQLANCVIVPSEHVRRTLSGVVPDEKIRVVNYGAPPVQPARPVSRDAAKPLKVLFVGALIQRKGIGYLLDAIDKLGSQVELTLVGMRFAPNTRVDAACNRWRWYESLSHSGVLEVMQEADVLVLPSLAEGCALVVLEALACGLPVIVTPNTGSLEFVRNGYEGFVVPICNSEAISDRLNQLNSDRDLLETISRNARATAQANSWQNYRETWAAAVEGAICQ